ncbi:MAG: hypothetical protein QOI36_159, partial [Pseudonocardiales bacterium]|nr:hypothetical protein [Pseudonocardiales bacterium]
MTIAEPGLRRYRPRVINVAGEQAGAGVGGTLPSRQPAAWAWLGALAGAVAVLLLAVAGRYGYHR